MLLFYLIHLLLLILILILLLFHMLLFSIHCWRLMPLFLLFVFLLVLINFNYIRSVSCLLISEILLDSSCCLLFIQFMFLLSLINTTMHTTMLTIHTHFTLTAFLPLLLPPYLPHLYLNPPSNITLPIQKLDNTLPHIM